jgi:hypothetical protein
MQAAEAAGSGDDSFVNLAGGRETKSVHGRRR